MSDTLSKNQIDWVNFLAQGKQALFSIVGTDKELEVKKLLSSIPRFKEEFSGDFICLYVGFEQNTFNEADMNIVLYLYNKEHCKGDWWKGSLSTTPYNGKVPFENTVDKLKKVMEIGDRISWKNVMETLSGKTFPAWVKDVETKKGNVYYTIVSIGGGGFETPKPLAIPADMELGSLLSGASSNSLANAGNSGVPSMPSMPSMPSSGEASSGGGAAAPNMFSQM